MATKYGSIKDLTDEFEKKTKNSGLSEAQKYAQLSGLITEHFGTKKETPSLSEKLDSAVSALRQKQTVTHPYMTDDEGDTGAVYTPTVSPSPSYVQGVNNIPSANRNTMTEHFVYSQAIPTYTSRYSAEIDALYNALMQTPAFSYEHTADPVYRQYADAYTREGNRAMQDTLGEVAARTGGIASSYAASAGAQANNYYMQLLADKIPELEQNAYARYLDGIQQDYNRLALLEQREAEDYAKYQDSLDRYYRDQALAYQQYLDQYEMQRDARNDALTLAQLQAQFGDLSGLRGQGVDTSRYEAQLAADDRQTALQTALQLAQLGDYGLLESMGVDTETLRQDDAWTALQRQWEKEDRQAAQETTAWQQDYEFQKLLAEQAALDQEAERAEYERLLELGKEAAKYGDYSILNGLGTQITAPTGAESELTAEDIASEAAQDALRQAYEKYGITTMNGTDRKDRRGNKTDVTPAEYVLDLLARNHQLTPTERALAYQMLLADPAFESAMRQLPEGSASRWAYLLQ